MAEPVLSLDNPIAAEPSMSGGKGASLARLRSLGLPVPDGVVVTTETYRMLVDDPEVETLLSRLQTVCDNGDADEQRAVAAELRTAIRTHSLPPPVSETLDTALPTGPYAVRSSATSEDLPGASFAGQYDTHLGVSGRGDVHRAIVECIASLFTDRAVAYRARNDIETEHMAMAVIVQQMVDPDVSGILFSADPITGDRDISIIDAGPGRGDAQVSGETTADTLRVNRRMGTIEEYRIGGDRTQRILTERDAVALVTIGSRIEDALGTPQDIEWAIHDGEISILQARPITALYPVPEPQPTDDRTHVYFSFGHRQGMTDAMPPLVLDLWREETEFVRQAFGLSKRFAATAGGRLYIDLTAYLAHPRLRDRILKNIEFLDAPAATALRALLEEHPEEFPLQRPSLGGYWRALRSLAQVWPTVGDIVRSLPHALLSPDPEAELERIETRYTTASERALTRIRSQETPAARLTTARVELRSSLEWLLEPFYGALISAMLAGRLLHRLIPGNRESVDALALGVEDDVVYQMTMVLGHMADIARESPEVEAALLDGTTLDELSEITGSADFLGAFDAFLDDYGFRAVGEIDFSRPRYREDPAPLLNVVASALETGERRGEHRRVDEQLNAQARAAERTLLQKANVAIRPLVKRLVAIYRGYIGIRELPKFVLSRILAELRTQVLEAADELSSSGTLSKPEDIWLLTFDELQKGLDDPRTLVGIDFDARRREFERVQRISPPRIITSNGYVPRPYTASRAAGDQLQGTGAAPGIIEGTVHVITNPGTERLTSGEILVAPYTDPGWTPLFINAAAVVTEVGGRLTHGSLVAREYGIPAVVAVEGATTRLETGDRVRVDGTSGTIELID